MDREERRRFIEDRAVVLFSVYRRRRDRLSPANASKSFHREITLRWLCHYPFGTPSMELAHTVKLFEHNFPRAILIDVHTC